MNGEQLEMQYCFVSYNPLHNVTNRDVATLINNHVYIRGTRSYVYRVVAQLHSFLNPFSLRLLSKHFYLRSSRFD